MSPHAPDVQSLGNAVQAIDNVFASVPKVKVNAPIAPESASLRLPGVLLIFRERKE
jgi:hypothetical protein